MKKFKLLKDLPGVKAGIIEEGRKNKDYTVYNFGVHWFSSDLVEKDSEFFEEIKEKERIEVTQINRASGVWEVGGKRYQHFTFNMSDGVPDEKLLLIKQAIEKELNDEQPEEKPIVDFLAYLVSQKELYVKRHDFETASQWRMVERLYRQYQKINSKPEGKYITLEESVDAYVEQLKEQGNWESTNKYFQHKPIEPNPMVVVDDKKNDWFILAGDGGIIISVKRLSDREVFTIGDEVEYRAGDMDNWDDLCGYGRIIKISISGINKNELVFEINDDHRWKENYYPEKYIRNIRHKKLTTPSDSGEFITAEKARRMAQRAFSASRLTNSCSINSGYIYRTFKDYEATITSTPDQPKPGNPIQ